MMATTNTVYLMESNVVWSIKIDYTNRKITMTDEINERFMAGFHCEARSRFMQEVNEILAAWTPAAVYINAIEMED